MKGQIKLTAIIIMLFLAACQSKSTEDPMIKISHGSEGLRPLYYGEIDNIEKHEIETKIKEYMIGKRFVDLPLIAFGDHIQIEADNFQTNEFKIYDLILDEKGNIISELEGKPWIISPSEKGKTEFTFNKSKEFIADESATVGGKVIHCLLIRSEINGDSFTFATLVLSELE